MVVKVCGMFGGLIKDGWILAIGQSGCTDIDKGLLLSTDVTRF
jgi:hypothetical protein